MDKSDELVLLERVFLRIGSAESDDQLQSTLAKFLTPVLLKLASPEEAVRKKVMELLIHINKRLRSRPLIQLPIESLLTQYRDPESSPFITNFSILYIKLGYPRLSVERQAELAPELMACLPKKPNTQQDSLLQILIPVLAHIKIPKEPEEKWCQFPFREKPEIAQLMLDFMMDVLLLPYGVYIPKASTEEPAVSTQGSSSSLSARPVTAPAGGHGSSQTPPAAAVPPGLSEQVLKRISGDSLMSAENLEKAKLGILKFLGAELFPEEDIVCHLIVAASDSRHSVATAADFELKRITGTIDWNSIAIMSKLYILFLGTKLPQNKSDKQKSKPEQIRSPVSTRVRLKVFPYFLKSRAATNIFPSSIQAVFEGIHGANTNLKLKTMAVQYVHHLCLHCEDAKLTPVGQVLLLGMRNLIKDDKQDKKILNLAYTAIGKIGKRLPLLVANDIGLVQTFFDAISKCDTDTRLGVQEALSMLAESYKTMDAANKKLLEAMLMQNIEKDEPQARMMAVHYAATVFPADHIPSRYILLLAFRDLKDECSMEAGKALRRGTMQNDDTTSEQSMDVDTPLTPDFIDMVKYVANKAELRITSQNKYTMGSKVFPFHPVTFTEVVSYLQLCLVYSAGITPSQQSSTTEQEHAPAISLYLNKLVEDNDTELTEKNHPIQLYIKLIRQLLSISGSSTALYNLLELIAVARHKLAHQLANDTCWIQNFISSSKDEVRNFAAQLYAIILVTTASSGEIADAIEKLLHNTKDKSVETQHGSLLALGYIIGDLLRRKAMSQDRAEVADVHMSDLNAEVLSSAIKHIATFVTSDAPILIPAACVSLGEIGRSGTLPLPSGGEEDGEGEISKYSIVKQLLAMVKSTKQTNKCREKAVLCLGQICIGEAEFPHRKYVTETLMDAITQKQLELHFSIGESLVSIVQGRTSPWARDPWVQTEQDYAASVTGQDDVEWYLAKLLSQYVPNVNPHLRQGACTWLLSLIKKCGHHASVQSRISEVQAAFMRLLSESDEITQDIASKGLGLVYEHCTDEQKGELVSQLVETLMTGKRQKHDVQGDTRVFQEGAIGKTPEGGSLSTYKELCSIANDLNQPDLIYKFMSLANHQASWNSRKGAAFGFSTIAAQAGEQLAPYLAQIVPKLYRYQFDPNPKIQMAMTSIWNALVKDNKKTVDTYLKQIAADLAKNLTHTQWRVRESSCMALADLLRGRPLDDIVEQLPELWEASLRVRDDIKESVRLAADVACKALSRASVLICDVTNGKTGEYATRLVLPCLLNVSLQSQVNEVRAIGLSTILKISKNAGGLLKPHIPVLVVALLEAVSGLEPQVLNYLSQHTGGSTSTQEKLDNIRISASKSSPMMETINRCVQYVDNTVLPELIPRITDLIKGAIGVATKAGCAGFITSLVQQCPQDLRPYAGKLLGALLNGLHDKNASVRKAYAYSIGHLVKVSKDSSVEKLIIRLKSWYLEKDEESVHQACGLALQAISQRAPDVLKRHAAIALPLAFFAMHEKTADSGVTTDDSKLSVWEDVWLEGTPGQEAGVRLYTGEILEILKMGLGAASWLTKAQAAQAMSTVASKLGGALGPPYLGQVIAALLGGLSGRTWDGKEALLQALSTVCKESRASILEGSGTDEGQPSIKEVVEAVLKESRKDNLKYKTEALRCLGVILDAYQLDYFTELWDIVLPSIEKSTKAADNDDESKDDQKDRSNQQMKLAFIDVIYEALAQGWPNDPHTQEVFQERLFSVLCSCLQSSFWKPQITILKATNKIISRLHVFQDEVTFQSHITVAKTLVAQTLTPALTCLGNIKYSSLRSESLAVIETVVLKLKGVNGIQVLNRHREELLLALSPLAEDSKAELQDKAVTIIQILNDCVTG